MAPRLPLRPLTGLVRGAGVMLCLGAASHAAAEEIVGAEFAGPTQRYAHGVLGDAIEYSELVIQTRDGNNRIQYRATLPSDHVFEDLTPRLWDITGDGEPEVVVVETDMARGGSLAVYDETGKVAETAHIGRSNRWLAPVAAADFDGDGRVEVAFVDRPHLAKTLRIFEWDGVGLRLDAEVSGLTNHRIGDAFFSSGMRDCGTGPEMVTADADWSDLMVIRFVEEWQVRSLGAFTPERLAEALDCGL
ncbi:VCBS repeat-containing protein [Octadecabacter sp. 1_MG-2023]|uniref:FG-GAP repeat domain-containing protein n=1 Tax=unclassified Octadecabacter TaxID=196158 RepID=UPI001C0865C5|nr:MULTISPECIES: VCBS repeat-containing protein [unclassified Octadecabacter]MBU2992877.1 VCBS repeat-containing protein [Octadecabacter sp. B2R22]MDO6733672.1 VCBS repeat-containing protein [Octadecabacter sp. 1_MG-2023]